MIEGLTRPKRPTRRPTTFDRCLGENFGALTAFGSGIGECENQESMIKNQESRIKNQGSRIKDQESRIKNQESRIKNQGSRIKDQGSRIRNQESRMRSQRKNGETGGLIKKESRKDKRKKERKEGREIKGRNQANAKP